MVTSESLVGIVRNLRWSVRFKGLPATCLAAAAKALSRVGIDWISADWYRSFGESRFDRRFGVDTAGAVSTGELGIDSKRAEDAVEYLPTVPTVFGTVLAGLEIYYSDYTFIDFGSGKGRVLLMASEFPYRAVEGIELSRQLHEIAERNIARYRSRTQRCHTVRSLQVDATEYRFPAGPLVVYLYNPFRGEVLRQVLENLRSSLAGDPRPAFLIYNNPEGDQLIGEMKFLEPVHDIETAEGYRWRLYRHSCAGSSGGGP